MWRESPITPMVDPGYRYGSNNVYNILDKRIPEEFIIISSLGHQPNVHLTYLYT